MIIEEETVGWLDGWFYGMSNPIELFDAEVSFFFFFCKQLFDDNHF